MTRLYIARHGNTFEAGEAPRRVGRRTDLPLTAAGRAQAEALGRRFAADGVMFGNGEVWLNGICKDDACADFDVKIVTIQSTAD